MRTARRIALRVLCLALAFSTRLGLLGTHALPTSAECRSGADLLAAFANHDVGLILVQNSLRLPLEAGGGSLQLLRNVTILGAHEDPSEWPVLDLAFIYNVVALGAGVTLTFRHVVTTHNREAPHFQAIGLDMIDGRGVQSDADAASGKVFSHPTAAPSGAASAHVVAEDTCIIQRSCLPPSFRPASMGGLARPALAPGPQLSGLVSQEGCVDDPAAHPMRRCWPEAGTYVDVVAQGADVEDYGGTPLPANYVLWLRNVRYVCDVIMPEQCAAELGPLDVRAGADSGGGASDDGGGPPLGAVLGGILGGVAFLAVVAAVLVVRMRRRRLSGAQHAAEQHSESRGAAKCATSACERVDTTGHSSDGAAGTGGEETSASLPDLEARNSAHVARAPSGLALGARTLGDAAFLPLPPAPLPPSLHHDPSDPHSALVPITRLTPIHPEVRLDVDLVAQEVMLLPVTRGKGSHGRVVEGMYGGQRVAVKLLDWGLAGAPQREEGGPGGEGEGGGEGGAGGGENYGGRRQQASQAALVQEVEVLGRCRHPNIVRLLAASLRPPSVCLVMELCDTSLERLLYGKRPEGM
ncbi:hypothetical protein TSOC_005098 [Tetrabaena socialis]|uniref:Protein kinase domain-containing protein n=1 Tax=Tetrabaena socialis TaxID=47790 RepID=A0A2J8A775_9CHLO|nr:hypothetical protein TSOC_005098 [Tetrabaena socialis]|eukprot:PNH08382.1 hypothetical protein TSOC_005098 [Tetrabaena socialis]